MYFTRTCVAAQYNIVHDSKMEEIEQNLTVENKMK